MWPGSRTLAALILIAVPVCAQPDWHEASELPPGPSGLVFGSRVFTDYNPCCAPTQSPSENEARLIASLKDRAQRDGPVLSLKLAGGNAIRLVDTGTLCADDTCRSHRLVAWWPAQGYYVVHVGLWEDQQAYLISETEGRTTMVFAPPVLSPSGRYAIAWDAGPASGKGLQLIDMSHYPPKIIEVPPPPVCPGTKQQFGVRPGPVWRDDAHVSFDGKPIFTADDPSAKQLLGIVDGKPEWEC